MADIRLNKEYCVVSSASKTFVNDYFESARVETLQTIQRGDTLDKIGISNLPLLPITGTIYKNKLYNYNGTTVCCIQTHERTIYDPKDTPALFSTVRVDTGSLSWIMNEKVIIGTIRIYNSVKYICIQAHMTVEGLTPDITPALWNVVPTSEEWTVGVAYKVNDIVTYLGKNYKCLQAHTSQAGWTPVAVPALWQLQ